MGLPNDFMGMSASAATWTPGQGDDGSWNVVGSDDTLSNRQNDTDVWGRQVVTWELTNSAVEVCNIAFPLYTVDPTKLYRNSVWVYKSVETTGEWHKYNLVRTVDGRIIRSRGINSLDGTIHNLYNTIVCDTDVEASFPLQQWMLFVYFVYPFGTNFGDADYHHADSGIYFSDGTPMSLTATTHKDAAWAEHTTYYYGRIRHGVIVEGTTTKFCYPRLDIVNGSEPTINHLLKAGNVMNGRTQAVSTSIGTFLIA